MKTRKVNRQYCQWHGVMETLAECSEKPTIEPKSAHKSKMERNEVPQMEMVQSKPESEAR